LNIISFACIILNISVLNRWINTELIFQSIANGLISSVSIYSNKICSTICYVESIDLPISDRIIAEICNELIDFFESITILDEQSKAFVEKVIPEILSDMKPDTLLKYSSSELINSATPEEVDKLFKWYGTLGKYQQMGDVVGGTNINYIQDKGKVVSAQYQVKTEFDSGPATVTVILVQRDDKWQIYNFKINSKAFVPQ
jgi:hypothetical protein